MSDVVPQLVLDTETGKVCIQIKLGNDTATQTLPEHLAAATKEELKAFFDSVVPEMIGGLRARRASKRRTIFKKAKDA